MDLSVLASWLQNQAQRPHPTDCSQVHQLYDAFLIEQMNEIGRRRPLILFPNNKRTRTTILVSSKTQCGHLGLIP